MKKLLAFFVIYCGLACNCFAQQAPGIEWQNTIGGSGEDGEPIISQTSNGGYIMGGFSDSNISGDKTEDCLGDKDYWILRLDSFGVIQWQNTIGGSSNDYLKSISQTSDGGFICGGYSASVVSGDKTDAPRGIYDYWILKLNSLGNIQWQKTIGGNLYDYLNHIQQTLDGGYIIGGSSSSSISGDKTEDNWDLTLNSFDFWIIKLDSLGNIQWQNTIGGSGFDQLESINQTSAGGYICGGLSNSPISGDKTENSMGDLDYWILKLDSVGNIQWQNTIGGSDDDRLFSIQQTFDGGYIAGGWSDSNLSGDKSENSQGGKDYWIIRLDSIGNIQWQNTLGGTAWEEFNSVYQTTDGGFVCAGNSPSNISGDKTENSQGGRDYWIIKLDSVGNINWQKTIGGNAQDILTGIQMSLDGGIIISGDSYSDNSGDKTENNNGINDYWIIKLYPDTLTSTTNIHSSKNNFKIFPNPATDYLSLTLASGEGTSFCLIKIYDVFGNLVLNKQSAITNYQLSVSNFSSGVYFVEVEADKEVYRSKFVKTANR